MTKIESCYDCQHESACYIRRQLKELANSDLLEINRAEWYTEMFAMFRKKCKAFLPYETLKLKKVLNCLGCGATIGIHKKVVNFSCYTCGTRQGYFDTDLKCSGTDYQAKFVCTCGFQAVSHLNIISNLTHCPGCEKELK